jgi:hypothetical protein
LEKEIDMSRPRRTLLLIALCLLSSSAVRAQQAADPTGHWEGTIQAPGMAIGFEIDFARNEKGVMTGTVNLPGERIKGLPLTKVAIEGRTISFHARSDQPMRGDLSADGKTIAGDYFAEGNTLPFTMVRTGDSKMQAPPKSPPITAQLEGTWEGTLETHGVELHLVLKLANRGDGTSAGRIVNLDQGELELPVAITQKGATVTLDVVPIVSSYAGTLNADGTELAGTFSQGANSAALTFRRTAAGSSKEQ